MTISFHKLDDLRDHVEYRFPTKLRILPPEIFQRETSLQEFCDRDSLFKFAKFKGGMLSSRIRYNPWGMGAGRT